jgi:hypothetical protein
MVLAIYQIILPLNKITECLKMTLSKLCLLLMFFLAILWKFQSSYEWRVNTVKRYIWKSIIARKPITRCYWRIKIFSTLCKHVPCNTLTHSTNEDLLNIKRKGDPEVSYVWYHWNPEPVSNKSHLLACFTHIDIFKLLTYWQEFLFLRGS